MLCASVTLEVGEPAASADAGVGRGASCELLACVRALRASKAVARRSTCADPFRASVAIRLSANTDRLQRESTSSSNFLWALCIATMSRFNGATAPAIAGPHEFGDRALRRHGRRPELRPPRRGGPEFIVF